MKRNPVSVLVICTILLIQALVFPPSSVSAAPAGFRLPFVGRYDITAGPSCLWNHQDALNKEAIDFGLPLNTQVVATDAGTAYHMWDSAGGNVLQIAHPNGLKSVYAHLSTYKVAHGQQVAKGQVVALSGNSGGSTTGAHLHFAVLQGSTSNTWLNGTSIWIRDMPGITWASGDPNKCAPDGLPDGYAIGPAISQPPTGYIDRPARDSGQAGLVAVEGWAKVDGSTISRVEIWIDGQHRGTAGYGASRPDIGGNYGWWWTWDTTQYANGQHTLQVKAIAVSGESTFLIAANTADLRHVQVDVQNPRGYIDTPTEGTSVNGRARISGWAAVSGSTISRIEIWIDGQHRGTATYGFARPDAGGNYGYEWIWDTATYSNGQHTIQVKAIAANGGSMFLIGNNTADLRRTQVTVENPRGYIDGPIDGSTVHSTVRIAGWAAVSGSTISRIEIWIDGQVRGTATYGFARPDAGGNYGYEWIWDTTQYTNGQHTLQVKAIAANGGSVFLIAANTADLRRAQIDVQNPWGYIDTPTEGMSVSGSTRIAGWAAVSGSTISRVEIWIDGQQRGTATYGLSRPDAGGNYGYEWIWDTATYSNGQHTIQVKAIAANGGHQFLLTPGSRQQAFSVAVQNTTTGMR